MSGHTPGPWEVRVYQGYVSVFAPDGTGMYFETVRHQRAEADACLISAAPELLEALQNACASWLPSEVSDAARAAIAKATGATP